MRKTIPFFFLIATVALIAAGCDRGDKPSTSIGGNSNAVLDDETTEDTETAAPTEPALEVDETAPVEEEAEDESTPPPLVVTWTDSADTSAATTLSFNVENADDEGLSFGVAVVVRSLVGEARTEIGDAALAPGESAEFSIDAQGLPVRSSAVVGQAFVELTREIAKPDGSFTSSELLAGRFVRHDAGYATVRAFTNETIHSELDGALWSTAASAEAIASDSAVAAFESEPLGEVSDGSGGYDVVTRGSAAGDLVVRNGGGVVVGFLSAVREIALSPEDAASAEETEASDE